MSIVTRPKKTLRSFRSLMGCPLAALTLMQSRSVGQERPLLIRSGSGDPELQMGKSERGGQAPATVTETNAGDRPPHYGNRDKRGGQAPALRQ